MRYGIANETGKSSAAAARQIIETAVARGVTHFDTAQAYGDSERVLGCTTAQACLTNRVQVMTKLDPSLDPTDAQSLRSAIEDSLRRLQIGQLWESCSIGSTG